MFSETLREHESGDGFTLQTISSASAFRMAEKMAFNGYSVKLSKEPGLAWIVVVTETAGANQHVS